MTVVDSVAVPPMTFNYFGDKLESIGVQGELFVRERGGASENRHEDTCMMRYQGDSDGPESWWRCTSCGKRVSAPDVTRPWLAIDTMPNFCPWCGRRVAGCCS